MECPKCGYEREPGDTHCSLCGVDFGLLERQEAEKKTLKASARKREKQDGGKLEIETTAPAVKDVAASGECPKCGCDRRSGDVECPHCGVIYEKHEQMLAQQKADEKKKKEEAEKRFAEEKARIQEEAQKGILEAQQKREKDKKQDEKTAKKKEQQESAVEAAAEAVDKLAGVASDKLKDGAGALKANSRKIVMSVSIVLAVLLVGWGITSLVKVVMKNVEHKRMVAQKEEEQRRIAEEQRKATEYFRANSYDVTAQLKSLIDQRQYSKYETEMQKYDIPQLAGDIVDIKKYLAEIKLFDKAKRISGKEYGKNYEVYLKLHEMNPGKKLYNNKLIYYRKKLAGKNYLEAKAFLNKKKRIKTDLYKALTAIDKAIQLEGYKKKYTTTRYKLKSQELLFFKGNNKVEMAVRNDGLTKGATGGQRKIYVWIRNVGSDSFFVNVDYFTLVGKNKKRYKYNDCSRSIVTQLKPGKEAKGYLYFYTSTKPRELIFSHISAGKISRKFP